MHITEEQDNPVKKSSLSMVQSSTMTGKLINVKWGAIVM